MEDNTIIVRSDSVADGGILSFKKDMGEKNKITATLLLNGESFFNFSYFDNSDSIYTSRIEVLYEYFKNVWKWGLPESLSSIYIPEYSIRYREVNIIEAIRESTQNFLNHSYYYNGESLKEAKKYYTDITSNLPPTEAQINFPSNYILGSLPMEEARILKNFKFTKNSNNKFDIKNSQILTQLAIATNSTIPGDTLVKDVPIDEALLEGKDISFMKLPLNFANYLKFLEDVPVGKLESLITGLKEGLNCSNSLKVSREIIAGNAEAGEEPYDEKQWALIGEELYSTIIKRMVKFNEDFKGGEALITLNELIFKKKRTYNRPNMMKLLTFFYKNIEDENCNADKSLLIFDALLGMKTKNWYSGTIAHGDFVVRELVKNIGEEKALNAILDVALSGGPLTEAKWMKYIEKYDEYSEAPIAWVKELL